MNGTTPNDKVTFTLSESAERHLQETLPSAVKGCSERGTVTTLSFSGGMRVEEEGKVLLDHDGPLFTIAGQKPEALNTGQCYNLLGFPVWIEAFETRLLQGRTLTTLKLGSTELEQFEQLVLKNVPEDYVETAMRASAGCATCYNRKVDQIV